MVKWRIRRWVLMTGRLEADWRAGEAEHGAELDPCPGVTESGDWY